MDSTKISVIIVSYNVREFLDLCLDSVFNALENIPSSEVFVVDNNSVDGSPEMVSARYPNAKLIASKENLGFSKGNNLAVNSAKGAYIHFLNPDTVVPEDFYSEVLAFMDNHPECGGLGPKLIDGKGAFSVDSKKAFPSFWVSVYKVLGISKLFHKSPKFNKYYRLDIPEDEIAPVEILSGSCLLVRKTAMDKAGGSFDEAYFMYGEDVDLCYRIHNSGFTNYYFPKVSVIHYKGESTKKLSRQYMKIFYDAHVRLVTKYYPKKAATFYINALRAILGLRNFFYVGRHFFALFKLFIFDILILTITTTLIKLFWFLNIVSLRPPTFIEYLPLLIFFLVCWQGSLFLNGAYDKPYSLFKAGRGMIIGTVFALAGYGLLPFELRTSRAVIFLSGLLGFLMILLFRWLIGSLGWIRLIPRDGNNSKAALVGSESTYTQVQKVLDTRTYFANLIGRIAPKEETIALQENILGNEESIPAIQKQFKIDELIFSAASLPYKRIIHWMQVCSNDAYFKIISSKSLTFTGSSSHISSTELYFSNQHYAINRADIKRNKRILDICISVLLLLIFPFIKSKTKDSKGLWENISLVFKGEKTWVGYPLMNSKPKNLPQLRSSVLPPYKILKGYTPNDFNKIRLAKIYAKEYKLSKDLQIIYQNIYYLGNN